MAMNTTTIFSRMMKTLRENSSVKEKREALTYISSQAKKLESSGVIKEERYTELCKLVIEAFTKEEGSMQYEALGALTAIVQEFQAHSLHLFELMLQTDKRIRLKILKLLEVIEDNAISAAVNDGQAVNFFKECLISVQPSSMEWITPTACVDNLQMLTKVEHHVLSDEQKLEEDTVAYSLNLLKRLYRLAAVTFDPNIEKFDILLMDKIVTLAYMGHKRQRSFALKVLQQAIATNSSFRIRKNHSEQWAQYKTNIQSLYCKRMLLLVAACETDWSIQWNVTIQLLGTDLHRGANLINNLLSVEEKAFKSTDTIIRRQAFLSWKLLIDNFALDYQELATARRIKLLCIPLNAKNSKTELISLTKLEVWWHLIIKLYKDITQFVTPVITQFLNFCFGPLGDTPLLSSKFNVVASPGKRFLKTKLVAVDALYQLIVSRGENSTVCAAMLEERLPHVITHPVFQECSKSITHSIGEAILILGQLTDQEMKNRFQLGKILWTSLMIYITELKIENKDHLFRDVILVVTELGNHFDKSMVKDMIFNVILLDLVRVIKASAFVDSALPELVLKLLSLPVLCEVPENFCCNDIECLLQRCISSEITCSHTFGCLQTIMSNLKSASDTRENMIFYIELWAVIATVLTKYTANSKKIDEGDKNGHNFKTVKSVLLFPLQCIASENFQQLQDCEMRKCKYGQVWKSLYKEFEIQSGSISTVKPNEILLDIASMIQTYLNKNNCSFIVFCLDVLLGTINYEHLFVQDGIPSIMQLIIDVVTIALTNMQTSNCEVTLKMLSAMLITVYGHNLHKAVLYLQICKSAIEFVLELQLKTLSKEVVSLWETVISIFRGLDKRIHREIFSLYKEVVLKAIQHSNSNIRSLAWSVFGNEDGSGSTAKYISDEKEGMIEKSPSHSKRDDSAKKKEETGKVKDVRVVGSFLNRKPVNTKSASNKPLERDEKNALILPEPDSQDYVYIKTDLKFDINRLTEHQKETLKKKREDIPALYNDLSQSSSQNTQNLQEWFDIKAKHINELDKANNKKNDLITQKPINNDANKENKIIVMQGELNLMDKMINNNNSNKLDGNVGDNIIDAKQKKDSTKEAERKDSDSHDENTSKQTHLTSPLFTGFIPEPDNEIDVHSTTSVTKRLNFESKEEFPEDKTHERQSSPSMFDSAKRRHRNDKVDTARSNLSLRSDEADENQKDSSTVNVQKTSRMKHSQGRAGASSSRSPCDDTDIKEESNESKKGIKRKYVSDTESDRVLQQRRKRKMISLSKDVNDDDKDKLRHSDNTSLDTMDTDGLSQRVQKEMSRLKIDMVFDCNAVNRRRIKHSDEGDKETMLKKVNTKDAKEGNDTSQGALIKRRSRRSIRQESEKPTESDLLKKFKELAKEDKEARKASDTDKVPLKNSADTDTTQMVPTTSQTAQDVTDRMQDEKLDDSKSISVKSEDTSKVTSEQDESSQDEIEDVVESSQALNVIKIDKICGEKQCFIKINKMPNIHAIKASDVIVEKNYVPESIPVDCGDVDVPGPCEQPNEATIDNNKETSDAGNKDSANKDVTEETDNSNAKIPSTESQKAVDGSTKLAGVITYSSPKGSGKVFPKLKSFTVHGRAAHMLGLVTKQSRIETDNVIVAEDDSVIKKSRGKDAETEASTSKKVPTVKEIDKIGGPSGSRQEKIFNNMRSIHDYACPSTYMFSGLKNDGEKLPSKVDKDISDSVSTDNSGDKENEENASFLSDKDDLPILEWSSANPPSLTASPSASILKRNRLIVSEPDPDSVHPNKRKRVSFADPPVSKEMGYEISTAQSPHKSSKFSTVRSLTPKKNSPRSKKSKLKFTSADAEKSTTEKDTSSEINAEIAPHDQNQESLASFHEEIVQSTVPVDCVETGDSETQQDIFDGSETNSDSSVIHSTDDDIDLSARDDSVDSVKLIDLDDSLMDALPTDEDNLEGLKDTDALPTTEDNVEGLENTDALPINEDNPENLKDTADASPTNEDNREGLGDTALPTNGANLEDFEDTALPNNEDNLEILRDTALPTKDGDLEDTVDIQNIDGLNSTVDPDEVFGEKLPRISTCEDERNARNAKNVAEQDTLSVTDSIFASLPSSQDSRCENQNNVQLDPEFLDSVQPIYPALSSCGESIIAVIEQLTTPLWRQYLQTYLTNRNLFTIGDLAQLSEREVNRMPLSGKSKIQLVRKVLQRYQSTFEIASRKDDGPTATSQEKPSDRTEQLDKRTLDEVTIALAAPGSIEAAPIGNETLRCSTPLASARKLHDHSSTKRPLTEHLDTTDPINEDSSICDDYFVDTSAKRDNADSSALDTGAVNERTGAEAPITAHSSPEKSARHGKPTMLPIATSSVSKSLTTITDAPSSDSINVSAIVCNEPLITHSSVGVGTDEVYSSEPAVKKVTRSVESQMALEDLLDEIDVNVVLESAVRRCSPESILSQYKMKMTQLSEAELVKETLRMLGLHNKRQLNDALLRTICHSYGINNVLLRLPDVFNSDKKFFEKVFKAYHKKLNIVDCLNIFDCTELENAICQKYTSSDLVRMLSEKLKREEQEVIL
ncbi:PREDICTED: telomere-associated protein RIF1-like isoform X2 [Dinoponera quadriceps]|uniref:Telomere-associated protein RIF1-like isoform X2 n=1 Tax=Dinoponera quadriceps TaxID=609295 RepID=A0A6P3XNI3_DINQU|nr:PREDICTED: telomere-associated protein RIF1-like isoform X2 [Dinoponera quadriceps]